MSTRDDLERQFYAGERTDIVKFVINDLVGFEAEDGSHRAGSVISIHSLEPEVSYLVEPGKEPWGDVTVAQSKMTLIGYTRLDCMDERDREILIEMRDDLRRIRERTDKVFEMLEKEVTPEDLEEIGIKHHPFKFTMKKSLGEAAGLAIVVLVILGGYLLARSLGWA